MTPSQPQDEDDDDSIYSGTSDPPAHSPPSPETVLDPTHPQTLLLDQSLDHDDLQYLRDNAQTSDDASDVGSVTLLSSDEDAPDETSNARGPGAVNLPSPPRYPAAPDFGDAASDESGNEHGRRDSEFAQQLDGGLPVGAFAAASMESGAKRKGSVVKQLDEDDDLFDSDEERVDVESLASSSESEQAADDPPNVVNGESLYSAATPNGAVNQAKGVTTGKFPASASEKQRSTTGGGGAYSLLTRAGQTFYRAFKKSSKKTNVTPSPSGPPAHEKCVGAKKDDYRSFDSEDFRHERVIQLLEAQIATLNGARTGFVDLRLIKPMTERTVEAIERDGKLLLADYVSVEKRCRELREKRLEAEREGDVELEAKEKMLITAKMRLAEAHAEVDGLRHELRQVQRSLENPQRVEALRREERRKRRDGASGEVLSARNARSAAEERLSAQKLVLQRETTELDRLEKRYQDIEGDWA